MKGRIENSKCRMQNAELSGAGHNQDIGNTLGQDMGNEKVQDIGNALCQDIGDLLPPSPGGAKKKTSGFPTPSVPLSDG